MTSIKQIAKSVKMSPKSARSRARRILGKKAPKGKWEFTPAQAQSLKKKLSA